MKGVNVMRLPPSVAVLGLFALGSLASLSVVGCGGGASSTTSTGNSSLSLAKSSVERDPVSATSSADLKLAVTANNAFAIDLYSRVAKGTPTNVLTSPISASLALTMTYAGARGTTASQMATALHFDPAAGSIFNGQNALSQALAARAASAFKIAQQAATEPGGVVPSPSADDYQLDVVNSVWGERAYAWESPFLDVLAKSYGTGVYLEDFASSPDPARLAINAWVSAQTADKINNLLGSGTLDTTTRVVLVNAIHLKLPWALPFTASQTKPGPFTKSDGSVVQASFMNQANFWSYVDDGQAQRVALPLTGNELEVVFALPHGDLATYEAALAAGTASLDPKSLEGGYVAVQVPKMTFTSAPFELTSALQAMGMTQAFDPSADFSGMCAHPSDGEPIYFSDVVQKSTLALQETGVEAAAATAVFEDAAVAEAPPPQVLLNRPFVLSIIDSTTGAILFLGHIADPTDQGGP
jgi:serpin B